MSAFLFGERKRERSQHSWAEREEHDPRRKPAVEARFWAT